MTRFWKKHQTGSVRLFDSWCFRATPSPSTLFAASNWHALTLTCPKNALRPTLIKLLPPLSSSAPASDSRCTFLSSFCPPPLRRQHLAPGRSPKKSAFFVGLQVQTLLMESCILKVWLPTPQTSRVDGTITEAAVVVSQVILVTFGEKESRQSCSGIIIGVSMSAWWLDETFKGD